MRMRVPDAGIPCLGGVRGNKRQWRRTGQRGEVQEGERYVTRIEDVDGAGAHAR